MPVYPYECPVHGEFDEIIPISRQDEPVKCLECGATCQRKFTTQVAFVVPPWMSATRSNASDRQTAYEASGEAYKNAQKWEQQDQATAERMGKAEADLDKQLAVAGEAVQRAKAQGANEAQAYEAGVNATS